MAGIKKKNEFKASGCQLGKLKLFHHGLLLVEGPTSYINLGAK